MVLSCKYIAIYRVRSGIDHTDGTNAHYVSNEQSIASRQCKAFRESFQVPEGAKKAFEGNLPNRKAEACKLLQ